MKYHILTLFPEMIEQGLHTSILGRAINNGYISLETTNIREFSANKFNRVDDYPYGGGAGMVMEAEPVFRAYQSVAEKIREKAAHGLSDTAGKSTEPDDGGRAGA